MDGPYRPDLDACSYFQLNGHIRLTTRGLMRLSLFLLGSTNLNEPWHLPSVSHSLAAILLLLIPSSNWGSLNRNLPISPMPITKSFINTPSLILGTSHVSCAKFNVVCSLKHARNLGNVELFCGSCHRALTIQYYELYFSEQLMYMFFIRR